MNNKKTIVYDYLFNYFGEDSYKGKIITGAGMRLAIKAYKNGEEIKFTKEPSKCLDKNGFSCYWNYIFTVSFDKEKIYTISKNEKAEKLFCLRDKYDKIEAEVVGYFLDFITSLPDDTPCSEPMDVSKEEFVEFIKQHIQDFDISDNIVAQVPSVMFVEL